jgi:phosphate transport system substrate-binding protein
MLMTRNILAPALLGLGIMAAATAPALAREQIRIVGSSTVFPFSTTVAERFGKSTGFKTPIVESTGSGGGLKLFCAGVGDNDPDITNSSRRIKASEVENCASNGITEIVEVKIGYDGIVLANSIDAPQMALSLRDLWLALAKNVPDGEGKTQPNPYRTWADVNPELPDVRIEVMGPPPTSGTRDAFVELAMEGGCKSFDWIKALKSADKDAYKTLCHTIREDGAFIEAGENDNLIVQKLEANPDAFGIFGFSFLDQNSDYVQGSVIDGVEPEFELISDGSYPISRSLYFYLKKSRVGKVPGIPEFLAEFTSEKAWGEEGYLTDKGLIPMSEEERAKWADAARSLKLLEM